MKSQVHPTIEQQPLPSMQSTAVSNPSAESPGLQLLATNDKLRVIKYAALDISYTAYSYSSEGRFFYDILNPLNEKLYRRRRF
ncbi:hypothetical protein RRG08_060246 [Elysia crispata]|uniref:Uncharacterized protein n=1 Tax=Elysia crispata TaxID=231223 RepID=A0AAE0ZX42_9GAST|nr:hypothetical protein RRG08_060246 [Elysia crispata]